MNRYIQYMYSYPHKTAYRKLENVNLRDYFSNLEGEGHSLYLHLPFCESKCGYCNLFSVTGCNYIQMDGYLDAILRQIKQYKTMMPQSTSFSDFTIGGGTPLLLESGQTARIFEAVGKYMPMGSDRKIIIETAPNQTDGEKAKLLKGLGVTRVSMGIQSFDNGELRWLGRNHDSERAKAAAGLLSGMGFECVNFDFIYGLPDQTERSLLYSLKTALSFSPDEIFLYPLYIKHGVRLEREGRKEMLDSGHMYALYLCGSAYLRDNGYAQISMRRFVKKNAVNPFPGEKVMGESSPRRMPAFEECGFKSALSLGCGGRSYLGRLHTCTPYRTTRNAALEEIQRYQQTEDFTSVTNGILLSDDEIKRRYVIRHLLILPGISRQAYEKAFQADLLEDFPVLNNWIGRGWLEESRPESFTDIGRTDIGGVETDGVCMSAAGVEGVETDGVCMSAANIETADNGASVSHDYIRLTSEGMGLSDYIGPQLISEDIMGKMLEWEQANA